MGELAVETNLVPLFSYHPALVWKRLERVAWNEPRRLHAIFVEELEEPADTDRACEQSSRDVTCRVFAAV